MGRLRVLKFSFHDRREGPDAECGKPVDACKLFECICPGKIQSWVLGLFLRDHDGRAFGKSAFSNQLCVATMETREMGQAENWNEKKGRA